jgi:hypothetical protein
MHIVLTSAEGCGLCKTLEWRPKAGDMWDLPVPVLSNLVVFTGCPSGLPCAVSIDEGALAFRVRTATSGKHTASGQHIGSCQRRHCGAIQGDFVSHCTASVWLNRLWHCLRQCILVSCTTLLCLTKHAIPGQTGIERGNPSEHIKLCLCTVAEC